MRINTLDWCALGTGVVEGFSGPFESIMEVPVSDINTGALDMVGRQQRCALLRRTKVMNVDVPSPKYSDWAKVGITIGLMVHADSFPPVFLIITFQHRTVGGQDGPGWHKTLS